MVLCGVYVMLHSVWYFDEVEELEERIVMEASRYLVGAR